MQHKTVLITGASSGIGALTAELFLHKGWNVLATARNKESLARLVDMGVICFQLDLASELSIQDLVDQLNSRHGAVDCLVNNAGIGAIGAVEIMPIDSAREIFEVNVFGLMRLTQLLLPGMRNMATARIINLSSIAGRWTSPGSTWYSASKYALEALSDGLRLELNQFGIKVVLVEPGIVASRFKEKALRKIYGVDSSSPYTQMMSRVVAAWGSLYERASSPEVVAQVIYKAATTRNPKARYQIGSQSLSIQASQLAPSRLWDYWIRQQMT